MNRYEKEGKIATKINWSFELKEKDEERFARTYYLRTSRMDLDEKNISEIIYSLYEDKFSFNPVTPPIYQTSNFYFSSFEELKKALEDEEKTHIYTRGKNPTTEVLEQKIAALEGGERALLFSSGVAAISAAVMGLLKSNNHVVYIKNY